MCTLSKLMRQEGPSVTGSASCSPSRTLTEKEAGPIPDVSKMTSKIRFVLTLGSSHVFIKPMVENNSVVDLVFVSESYSLLNED